ncbi:MAG: heat-inducible transcriptional repressor HrcA [Bacillota bacterium]|nr:heat-inducible transcriptional repressor HrcA [Bacillota bacterium]
MAVLDERKQQILRAVTDDYISTAEPVGSRTIARRYNLGLSPATIRNEMADLEEAGYLQQPHTSAGRIPSEKGYRFYVDELLIPADLDEFEAEIIRRHLRQRPHELMALIHQATRLLGELTSYTTIVLGPVVERQVIKHLSLVGVRPLTVLALLVIDPGFIRSRLVEVEEPLEKEALTSLSEALTARLRGAILGEIGRNLLSEVRELIPNRTLAEEVLHLLEPAPQGAENVYVEGVLRLLTQPEFRDVEKARPLLAALEAKETLTGSLYGLLSGEGKITVRIGQENPQQAFRECSLVAATYGCGGRVMGILGVFGPMRMDYGRAISTLRYLAEELTETLSELGGE